VEDARRQLSNLRHPPAAVRLVRPCTLGDGIVSLGAEEMAGWLALHDEAARAGRVVKFVPASGAASRMFRDLLALRASGCPPTPAELAERERAGDREAATFRSVLVGIGRFAFADDLRAVLAARGRDLERVAAEGPLADILDALLDPAALGFGSLPKALLPFHRYGTGVRTALEEHLVEASELARDGRGVCRVHFTIAPGDGPAFERLLARARPELERKLGVRFEVELSTQKPGTDTLAIDGSGAPFRDDRGTLVLRPGGHGALLENLAELRGDLVHVKNVDNVATEALLRKGIPWRKALVGLAVLLEREARERLRRIETPECGAAAAEEARRFVVEELGADPGDEPGEVARILRRPIRACGVVRNTGEPGGGPFWVRDRNGRVGRQIVEAAQVDARSEEQARILGSSTHFNPVDMALALRDPHGGERDLRDHVDPDAVFLAWKSWGGRDLLALERPGLWNGAMAGWNSVFVEVPLEVFNPVKTVLDLLRPEHQA
jgi:hypothetical protein